MLSNLTRKIAVGIAFTGVAAGAYAFQPPNPNSEASVNAWLAKNVQNRTANPPVEWAVLGADAEFVIMDGVIAPKDAGGIGKAGLRLEFYAPTTDAGQTFLSRAELFDIDCNRNMLRQTSSAGFAQHNLSSPSGQAQTITSEWEPIGDHPLASAARRACSGAPAGPAPALPTTASVDYRNREAVVAWQQRNVQLSAGGITWQEMGGIPLGMLYYGTDTRNSESRTNRRIRVRQEFFDPVQTDQGTVVAIITDFDLNCIRNEARRVQVTAFAQRNLAGQGNVTNSTQEAYRPAAEVSPINSVAADICRAVQAAPTFR